MTRDLPYWKGKEIDAQLAYKYNGTYECFCAIGFAQRKVQKLERISFERSRYENN